MTLSRRDFVGAIGAAALACAHRSPAHDDGVEIVELSHPLGPASPYIVVEGATFPFRRAPIATIEQRGVYANRWELTEHIGTHLDAPCHFAEQAPCLEEIPAQDLLVEAVVIDLRERAARDADTELGLDDLAAWEAAHGPLPRRCAVLLASGWDARWSSQERFANADASGVRHHPGFALAALERLAASPRVFGVGVDTFSIDPGSDVRYRGHRVWSAAKKWALECLANLGRLPPRGARLFAGAPRVERASGAPARVIAWVPRRERISSR